MAHDPGIANERTALAWQRTALSLLTGAALVARLGADRAGPVGFALLGLAALLSAWMFVESTGRYRHSSFGTPNRPRGRGGRAPLFLALATALIAAGELVILF